MARSFGSIARESAAAEYGRRNVAHYALVERLKWGVPLFVVLVLFGGPRLSSGASSAWDTVSGYLVPAGVVLAVVVALVLIFRSGLGKGYRNRW